MGKTLFIDAIHEFAREKTQSFLRAKHQSRILTAYQAFGDESEFSAVATTDEILAKGGDLTVHHYVTRRAAAPGAMATESLGENWERFDLDGREFWMGMDEVVVTLDGVIAEEVADA